MAKTCEELYILRIENGIRAIKMRTKSPEQVDITSQFKRLKLANPNMYEDLQEKYIKVVSNYNNK
jgi:hypothetical protein